MVVSHGQGKYVPAFKKHDNYCKYFTHNSRACFVSTAS